MNNLYKYLCIISLLVACSAKELKPEARGIQISRGPVPKKCIYKGQVVGEQGGAFTGSYTSNKNLALGAMNDLRNQAYEIGANYIVLIDTQYNFWRR